MRGRVTIEEIKKDREAIIVHEIHYQVNKAAMITKIAELVREKRIEGIADLRDESDRNGIRVVVELKKDASAEVVLNQLYRFSQMQTSFGVNMLALNGGRPELMNLRKVLDCFVTFRQEVVVRRTKFELNKARDRAHVLVGLAMAVANIDEVIRIIRSSPDPATARESLLSRDWPASEMAPLIKLIADRRTVMSDQDTVRLSDEQARAILELRLHRLTALGADEIGDEAKGLSEKIADLLDILRSRARILDIIRGELNEVKTAFAVPRRSEFTVGDLDLDDEDLIEREEMVVTFTHGGYVKRTPLTTYRSQHRGGKGRSGMAMKDEDFVTRLFAASTHAEVLFFSSTGMVYKHKVWRLPLGSPQSKGKALVNILPLDKGEWITSVMLLPEEEAERERLDVMFATRKGGIRRNKLMDFVQVNRNGKIAMKPDEDDGIVDVQLCNPNDDVLLTTARAQCIRFRVDDVRVFTGRTSTGVRGIRLADGDKVISLAVLRHVDVTPAEARAYLKHAAAMRRAVEDGDDEVEAVSADTDDDAGEEIALNEERLVELGAAEEFILTITDKGMGKRASAYDYRVTGRGGKGLIAHRIPDDANLAASFPVDESDDVMMVTNGGQLIRCPVNQIRIAGRSTQGVRVLRTNGDEKVVSVERLAEQEDKNIEGDTEAED
ncbi:MAG TPA: DNA gyrase subunit A, partial [Hyphomonadaceae bacterium]|nr:DNA gyrase subunit A [Hyphomonadaceae bacterium]